MRTIFDVETDPDRARALASSLGLDYRVIHCPECADALASARRGEAHAVIIDLEVQRCDPFLLLEELGKLVEAPPILAITGVGDPRPVVRAIRFGAADVLHRSARPPDIREVLGRCLGGAEEEASFFLGTSSAMEAIKRDLRNFARWDFPLLITGESGTGKELAAKALHELSGRKTGPHVARNCAALPSELVESELFGAHRGAFTGSSDRPGAFELADGGTLFLDEIGEASPETQTKLLRALESGGVWRLGARAPVRVDVRFVSATNRDLEEAMDRGRFRPDLFYRIETLRLRIPPLREHREDIPILARHFVRTAARGGKDLSRAALQKLTDFDWPGNVRQLRNAAQRAVVLSGERETIGDDDIVL